jgi:hypothetical protein
MPERVLISTFGFDPEKVLLALRSIGYDRLTLIAGGKSLREPGFRRLEAAEQAAGGAVEVVAVDPFDFRSCFEGALGAIQRHRKAGREVRVNVSGGTKVLADAALLAAFQEGVEAWHCEDRPVRLPVLRGIAFSDGLNEIQKAVLVSLERPRPAVQLAERLRGQGHSERGVQAAINRLREQGLVAVTLRGGAAVVSVDPGARWFVKALTVR